MASEVRPIDANAINWHESTECFGHGWFETVKKVYAEDIAAMPTLDPVAIFRYFPASNPPERSGEYICKCSFPDSDFSFYMVLRYFLYDKNPHFQHERIGGMRVTHWAPLPVVPEDEV